MNKIDFKKEVEKHKDDIVKMISEWVQIKSVTGEGTGPKDALKYGLEQAEKMGFKTETFHDNTSGHIVYGDNEEYVGILGHCDVVPVNEKAWKHPPFSGKVVDGEIWGRGTQDDKGPTVLALFALKIIKDLGLPVTKAAKVIIGTQEEGGDWSDIENYFKSNPDPVCGFTPDSNFPLIYAEKGILRLSVKGKTNFTNIEKFTGGVAVNAVAPTASVLLDNDCKDIQAKVDAFVKANPDAEVTRDGREVSFKGTPAHAKNPEKGHSAIWDMTKFIASVESNDLIDFYVKTFVGDNECKNIGLAKQSVDGHQTINTGIFNFEKGEFEIIFDLRCPNDVKLDDVQKKFEETFKDYSVTVANRTDGLFVDPKDPLIQTLEKAYRDVTGDMKSPLVASGGGTYAKAAPNTVAFGAIIPGVDESRVHQYNERMKISSALTATEVYCHAIYNLMK